nr:MAG TPA: hypothetical protein [Caudoviricetes sp.]
MLRSINEWYTVPSSNVQTPVFVSAWSKAKIFIITLPFYFRFREFPRINARILCIIALLVRS